MNKENKSLIIKEWGYYRILSEGKNYKVKKIVIKSKHRISLQYHKLREEHWFIVSGKALVTIDKALFNVDEYDNFIVHSNVEHRIENKGENDLIFIEIQIGQCREDDIVRLEDDYGRVIQN